MGPVQGEDSLGGEVRGSWVIAPSGEGYCAMRPIYYPKAHLPLGVGPAGLPLLLDTRAHRMLKCSSSTKQRSDVITGRVLVIPHRHCSHPRVQHTRPQGILLLQTRADTGQGFLIEHWLGC